MTLAYAAVVEESQPTTTAPCVWCGQTYPIYSRGHRVVIDDKEYSPVCDPCIRSAIAPRSRREPSVAFVQQEPVSPSLLARLGKVGRGMESPLVAAIAAKAGMGDIAEAVARILTELKRLRSVARRAAELVDAIDGRNPAAMASAVNALKGSLSRRDRQPDGDE